MKAEIEENGYWRLTQGIFLGKFEEKKTKSLMDFNLWDLLN